MLDTDKPNLTFTPEDFIFNLCEKYDCPVHPGDGYDWVQLGKGENVFCPTCLGDFLATKMPIMEKRKERDA